MRWHREPKRSSLCARGIGEPSTFVAAVHGVSFIRRCNGSTLQMMGVDLFEVDVAGICLCLCRSRAFTGLRSAAYLQVSDVLFTELKPQCASSPSPVVPLYIRDALSAPVLDRSPSGVPVPWPSILRRRRVDMRLLVCLDEQLSAWQTNSARSRLTSVPAVFLRRRLDDRILIPSASAPPVLD